jgi:hypothetical protein
MKQTASHDAALRRLFTSNLGTDGEKGCRTGNQT